MVGGCNVFDCWDNCPACGLGTIWRAYCYLDGVAAPHSVILQRTPECLTPSRQTPNQRWAFLIGDSHSASIKPGIERAMHSAGAGLSWLSFTGNGCGYHYGAWGVCYQARNLIDAQLRTHLMPGDLVIIKHARWKNNGGNMNLLRQLYTSILQPRGAKLVIVGDPAWLSRWARWCIYAPQNCYSPTTVVDSNVLLAPLADEFPGNVLYISIWNLFCTTNHCQGQVPGTTTWAYFDNNHLTRAGGEYLGPYFCSALSAAGFL